MQENVNGKVTVVWSLVTVNKCCRFRMVIGQRAGKVGFQFPCMVVNLQRRKYYSIDGCLLQMNIINIITKYNNGYFVPKESWLTLLLLMVMHYL